MADTETFDCKVDLNFRGDTLSVRTNIWKAKNGKGRRFCETEIIYFKIGKEKADTVMAIFAKHLGIPAGATSRTLNGLTELQMVELENAYVAALGELYAISLARTQGAAP